MATYETIPDNKSFLSNNKFDFTLERIPNFTFLVQSASLPNMSLSASNFQTPLVNIQIPGTMLTFAPLTISFIVDENMESWYEIYNWMFQLGNPEELNKIGNLTGVPGALNNIVSDANLIIKTNSNNPNWRVRFHDLFPTDIGEINFSTIDTQEFITSSATFAYTYYELERI
jgi:hypothetical protein